MKKEKGITIIALVITVIILLILAGVAISMINGNGGIFTKANESATLYNQKALEEAEQLEGLMDKLEQYGSSVKPITEVITNLNIGEYIDLGTNILVETILSGINSNDNQSRPDEIIKADYRILYVGKDTDSDAYRGKVFAILADYLPNSSNIINNSGLLNIKQLSENPYGVKAIGEAQGFADDLKGPYMGEHPLMVLAGNKVKGKKVAVSLSPTAVLLQISYNTKINSDRFVYHKTLDTTQSLYVPRLKYNYDSSSCWGYELATAIGTNSTYYVRYQGDFGTRISEWYSSGKASRGIRR